MCKRAVDADGALVVVAARKGWSDNWWGKEKGRAGKHGLEWGDVGDRCQPAWRPRAWFGGELRSRGRGPPVYLYTKVAERRGG